MVTEDELDEFLDDERLNDIQIPGQSREDNGDDMEIKPMSVFDPPLSHSEIMKELESRGQRSCGFPDEDARALQALFDAQHETYVERVRAERREKLARVQKQQRLQKKRLLHERQLAEEAQEVDRDPQLAMWLDMIRQNVTQPYAKIEVNSITARVVAQALWENHSLTCLNLSKNELNDFAGLRISRSLKRNSSLRKLELDGNNLGPRTCVGFGEAFKENTSLHTLSLESNFLTKRGIDCSGIHQMVKGLAANTSLTSLNLWRCDVGAEAGAAIRQLLTQNSSLVHLDVGNNGIPLEEEKDIGRLVRMNLQQAKKKQHDEKEELECQAQVEHERRAKEDAIHKQEEVAKWMEDMKSLRAETRRKELEADRIRAEQARKRREEEELAERERKAKLEAESKKKKKKGKKKK